MPIEPDALTAHLPDFGNYLTQRWRRNRPDVAHAHSWTMGLAALAGARGLGIPVVQTFGSLGAVAALLMWFWISAYAIGIGAEVNAAIEEERVSPEERIEGG